MGIALHKFLFEFPKTQTMLLWFGLNSQLYLWNLFRFSFFHRRFLFIVNKFKFTGLFSLCKHFEFFSFSWKDIGSKNHLPKSLIIHLLQNCPFFCRINIDPFGLIIDILRQLFPCFFTWENIIFLAYFPLIQFAVTHIWIYNSNQ